MQEDLEAMLREAVQRAMHIPDEVVEQAYHRALELYQSGNYEQAAVDLRCVVDEDPKYAPAYLYLAAALIQSGNSQEGATVYQQFLQLPTQLTLQFKDKLIPALGSFGNALTALADVNATLSELSTGLLKIVREQIQRDLGGPSSHTDFPPLPSDDAPRIGHI